MTKDSITKSNILDDLSRMIHDKFHLTVQVSDYETSFLEMGFDSVSLIKIKQCVQDAYGVEIAISSLFDDVSTVNKLADYILQQDIDTNHSLEIEKKANNYDTYITDEREQFINPIQPRISSSHKINNMLDNINQQLTLLQQQYSILSSQYNQNEIDKVIPPSVSEVVPSKSSIIKHVNKESEQKAYNPFQQLDVQANVIQDNKKNYINKLIHSISNTHQENKRHVQYYRRVLANNRNVAGYRHILKEAIHPIIIDRADEAKVIDIDHNEYIDFTMGFGTYLLGHSHPTIKDIMLDEINRGFTIGPMSRLTGKVARLVCALTKMERVAFYNSGTEAVMVALRLARATTKRNKVVIFEGAYHGSFDGVLARKGPHGSEPIAPGILDHMVKDIIVLPYDNMASIDVIFNRADEIAAVLVEPVQSRKPDIQPREFLRKLRKLTEDAHIALIFDEVITGFRIANGGAQEWFSVKADMCIYGKIVGGGLPIGLVAGSAEYLDCVDGGYWEYGDDSYPCAFEKRTFVSGTFCHHPLTMATSYAVLTLLEKENGNIQRTINNRTDNMVKELSHYFEENGLDIRIIHFGSLFRFEATFDVDLFYLLLLKKGIYIWEGRNLFMTYAHNEELVATFIEAVKEALEELVRHNVISARPKKYNQQLDDNPECFSLSMNQKKIFLADRVGQKIENLNAAMKIEGDFDLSQFRHAIRLVVEENDILRTRIDSNGENQIVLKELEEERYYSYNQIKDNTMSNEGIMNKAVDNYYDLTEGPLFKIIVNHLGGERYLIIFSISPMIADGWSLNSLMQKIAHYYTKENHTIENQDTKKQYFDYIKFMNNQISSIKNVEYERVVKKLQNYNNPILPSKIDHLITNNIDTNYITLTLDKDYIFAINQLCLELDCTNFHFVFACFSLLISRITGQSKNRIGIALAGQTLIGEDDLIGQCVEIVPISLDVDEQMEVIGYTSYIKKQLFESVEQYIYLTQYLRSNDNNISVLFNMDSKLGEICFGDLQGLVDSIGNHETQYDLNVNITYRQDCIQIQFIYQSYIEKELIQSWTDMFKEIIDMYLNRHNKYLLSLWNKKKERYVESHSINQEGPLYKRIEYHAIYNKEAIALKDGKDTMTYKDMNDRANQIAYSMITTNMTQQHSVAIAMENKIDGVCCMLGCMKLGVAYVFVDVASNKTLLEKMENAIGIDYYLTDCDRLDTAKKVISMHTINWHQIAKENVDRAFSPNKDFCFIIKEYNKKIDIYRVSKDYTQKHCNSMINNIYNGQCKAVMNSRSYIEDGGIDRLLPALVGGLTYCEIANDDIDKNNLVSEVENTSFLYVDKPELYALIKAKNPLLEHKIIIVADSYIDDLFSSIQAYDLDLRIIAMFRPVTLPLSISFREYSSKEGEDISKGTMGQFLVDEAIFMMDNYYREIDRGLKGELCIEGIYLIYSETRITSYFDSRMISHVFSLDISARLLATGEYVVMDDNHTIRLLGFGQHLIRMNGLEVHKLEVEEKINGLEEVRFAYIHRIEDEKNNSYRLIVNGAQVHHQIIRNKIYKTLKNIMKHFKLILIDDETLVDGDYVDEEYYQKILSNSHKINLVEDIDDLTDRMLNLQDIWSHVLSMSVDIDQDFFEIGGTSLQAIQLMDKINERFHIHMTLSHLIENASINKMHEAIKGLDKDSMHQVKIPEIIIDTQNQYQEFPLTDVQQAYWVGRNEGFDLGNIATHTYFEIDSAHLDASKLEKGFNRIIQRHGMLRTIFTKDGMQQTLEKVPYYALQVEDITAYGEEKIHDTLESLRKEMSHLVMDTSQWPLFNVRLLKISQDTTRVFFSIDALIMDTWSFQIMIKELAQFYHNPSLTLSPLAISFRDYVMTGIILKDSAIFKDSKSYWQERIDTLPHAPELPIIKAGLTVDKPIFNRKSKVLSGEKYYKMKKIAQKKGVTVSNMLLTAYTEVLALWSKTSHFTLNLTLFNPMFSHKQINQLVGDFTSLVLLEISHNQQEDFFARVKRNQLQLWKDLEHRFYSGVQVIRDIIKKKNMLMSDTLMPVVFTCSLMSNKDNDTAQFDWLGDVAYTIGQTPQVWLDHEVFEKDGELVLNWDYVESIFPEHMITDMFTMYTQLVEELLDNESYWDMNREMIHTKLFPTCQKQIIDEVNDTKLELTYDTLQSMFMKSVSKNGDRVALVYENIEMTYNELYLASGRLAYKLKQMNIGKNDMVLLAISRGFEQIIGMLGVSLAGAAYVPLYPEDPEERIKYLIRDTNTKILLTNQEGRYEAYKSKELAIVNLNDEMISEEIFQIDLNDYDENDLAYVIYTSGSTGRPKGVMISHKAVINTIYDINDRLDVNNQDKVLSLSSYTFDLSVYDIFGLLHRGGSIVLVKEDKIKEPSNMYDIIMKHKVTIWNTVPITMEIFLDYLYSKHLPFPPSMTRILLSGDWINKMIPEKITKIASNNVKIFSLGGATEGSIWSIIYPIQSVDSNWNSIPYGKPLSNQTVKVCNRDTLVPCPVGVVGEIYIGGKGVAIGYLNEVYKTHEAFITKLSTHERLYRTGDFGRYMSDGNIEFLGRLDSQVKVQGYRIELEEISTLLNKHEAIEHSAVYTTDHRNKKLIAVIKIKPEKRAMYGIGLDRDNLIQDPIKRLHYKMKQPGIRRKELFTPIGLDKNQLNLEQKSKQYAYRRSFRHYIQERIEQLPFFEFLSALAQYKTDGMSMPKYRYASAGGLYPVQMYLYCKENAIDDIKEGFYYYSPIDNLLYTVDSQKVDICSTFELDINLWNKSSFTIFLVADMNVLRPMYAKESMRYATIEAGLMTQLLESVAHDSLIGLCQLGHFNSASIKEVLSLTGSYEVLNCIVGGKIEEEQATVDALIQEEKVYLQLVEHLESTEDGTIGSRDIHEDLINYLKDYLPNYMIPHYVELVDEIPVTDNNKMDKKKLKAMINTDKKIQVQPKKEKIIHNNNPHNHELKKDMTRIIQKILKDSNEVKVISPMDNFFDMGANSIDLIRFKNELSVYLNMDIPVVDIFNNPNIQALTTYLNKKISRGKDSKTIGNSNKSVRKLNDIKTKLKNTKR